MFFFLSSDLKNEKVPLIFFIPAAYIGKGLLRHGFLELKWAWLLSVDKRWPKIA